MNDSSYTVHIERDLTVAYRDSEGTIKFGVEFGGDSKGIELGATPLTEDLKVIPRLGANSARLQQAYQKVIEYLRSPPRNFSITEI